ncbi:MAG: hypothetical protein AAGG46_03000 [Planctomycetota bacterium]
MDSLLQLIVPSIAAVAAATISAVATLVATRMQTRHAEAARLAAEDATPPRCLMVTLHAKAVRWEVRSPDAEPLYVADTTRMAGVPSDVEVFDEAHYTNLTVYDKPTDDHEASFRTSGEVDVMCLEPWRDRLRFSDRAAANDPHQLRQSFSGSPSRAFVVFSHAYNGLQPGSEDFAVKMPRDAETGRLVVDLSSTPHIVEAMTAPPRGELRSEQGGVSSLSVLEYRRGIYCVEHRDLRRGDVLLLDLSIDWERLCPSQAAYSATAR